MIPVVLPTYARADVAFDRGEGAWLYDTKGQKYLDFASGVAVTSLGHAHPHLVEALTEQAKGTVYGNPLDDNTYMGPVISSVQLERVQGFIERTPDHATDIADVLT